VNISEFRQACSLQKAPNSRKGSSELPHLPPSPRPTTSSVQSPYKIATASLLLPRLSGPVVLPRGLGLGGGHEGRRQARDGKRQRREQSRRSTQGRGTHLVLLHGWFVLRSILQFHYVSKRFQPACSSERSIILFSCSFWYKRVLVFFKARARPFQS
jgi:hypothetical protein